MASMFYVIASAIVFSSAISFIHSCPPSDRAALLAIKAALNESHLGIFNTWTGIDCCRNWYGVSCDPETWRVTDINLRGESEDPIFQKAHRTGYMTGSISPSICKLDRLSSLTLADWKGISGPIPSCITISLPFLRILELVGNKLSGELPADIGQLSRLTVLNVADNMISGRFQGEIPASLGRMSVLATLNLDGNNISGTIPPSLITSRIEILNLSKNSIVGNIPDIFGPRTYFTVLDLAYNKLKGKIPRSIVSAAYVGHLDVSHNHLCGPIPVGSPFDHLEASSFEFNDCLCGKPLRAC